MCYTHIQQNPNSTRSCYYWRVKSREGERNLLIARFFSAESILFEGSGTPWLIWTLKTIKEFKSSNLNMNFEEFSISNNLPINLKENVFLFFFRVTWKMFCQKNAAFESLAIKMNKFFEKADLVKISMNTKSFLHSKTLRKYDTFWCFFYGNHCKQQTIIINKKEIFLS